MKTIVLFTSLLLQLPLNAQTLGSFTDDRDGQIYSTVTYEITLSDTVISDLDEYKTRYAGETVTYALSVAKNSPSSMAWMTEDLRHIMEDSFCFNEVNPHQTSGKTADSCDPSIGRLYTWPAATQACPAGWHLPSDDEWYLLAHLYGGVASAGTHLKSTELRGSNKSHFNALRSSRNIFWSSDEKDDETAWDWKVLGSWTKLQRWTGQKIARNAVRCVSNNRK